MAWSLMHLAALAVGAALSLIAARAVPPGAFGLGAGLAGAAVLMAAFGVGQPGLAASLSFALSAGAGAAAAAVDARHQLLPDASTGLIALGGLVAAFSRGEIGEALIASALSAGILACAAFLTRRPGRPAPMGQGDIFLAGACGLWLTPEYVPYALIGAAALTALGGAASGALQGGGRMAFGPGLLVGFGLCAAGLPLLNAVFGDSS